MKILIADDDTDARGLFEIAMAGWGCEVAGAADGAQALEKARLDPPDLIISDVMMPEMDGFMFCRKVKEDLELKKIPFILYTATRAEPDEEELALKLGAARFIRKPVKLEVLRLAIEEEFKKSGAPHGAVEEKALTGDQGLDKTYMEVLSRKFQAKGRELESALGNLARSEAMYRRLVENTPDIVYSSSATRGLIYCSPKIEPALGYSAAFLLENPFLWRESIHPEDLARMRARVDEAGAGKCVDVEYRIRSAGGGWRWFRDRSVARAGEAGEELFDGIAADVTGLKLVEEKPRKIQESLFEAQKLDIIGRLSGGLAHDLNNLLGPIMGYADFLKQSLPGEDPRQRDITEIMKAADRAARLVRQLMAFSRTQLMQPRVVNMNDIISAAVGMLSRIIGGQFRLTLGLDQGLGKILIDPVQLEQALINLVTAASEAMPRGGDIFVSTRALRPVSAEDGIPPGDYAGLFVRDSGPGMDETARGRIFEPFFVTKNPGSGLRFPTVFGIVKQSGGEIRVESSPGKGTEFRIYLPLVKEAGYDFH